LFYKTKYLTAVKKNASNKFAESIKFFLLGHSDYLVNCVRVNRVVEASVQIVKKINHLKGRRACGYRREANDVREINRDLSKLFGIDGHAELQFFGD
jgi:hypothetical protein